MNQTISADRTAPPPELLQAVEPTYWLDSTVWVLLWSQSQNALHIEPLADMMRTNLEAFHKDGRLDYVLLCIGSREAVDASAQAVRPICHARAEAHAARREVV